MVAKANWAKCAYDAVSAYDAEIDELAQEAEIAFNDELAQLAESANSDVGAQEAETAQDDVPNNLSAVIKDAEMLFTNKLFHLYVGDPKSYKSF